jgi:carbonic anhydrase
MKERREIETEQRMDQEHDASRNIEEKKPQREKPFKLISDFDKDFDFAEVFQRNRAWAETKRSIDPDFFAKLAKGQKPSILWIGCSDARVSANLLIGADSGAVFVHRNIANQVLAIDINAQSVLQYAIEFLHVPHIVVCGHYDCGGVRAALRNLNHGSPLENWLRNIRDVWRLHYDDVEKYPEGEPRARRLIELNVIEQCLNVYKTASGKPVIAPLYRFCADVACTE